MEGVKLAGEKGYSVYERIWTRPSLTVIAMESHPIQGSSNQIVDSARARLSLRTVPNMDGRKAGALLVKKLTKNPPHGAKVTAKVNGSTPWWTTDPDGPAFEAARRALKAGFKKDTAMIGAGGSIGFVQPFADLLGGADALGQAGVVKVAGDAVPRVEGVGGTDLRYPPFAGRLGRRCLLV